jgi:hypothetical protein
MLEYWNNGQRGCRERRFGPSRVIPAEAGIQVIQFLPESRLRGSDSIVKFFRGLLKKFKDSVALHNHYSSFPLFHHSSSPVEL